MSATKEFGNNRNYILIGGDKKSSTLRNYYLERLVV
ncbi:hypothetical protein NTE_02220 [Candidatus Nitrososphaera evergladensis SR1]|uniref:Uncharacterized protein n=1 Tax=Candidatus Nitrososphaera evergladensis SR1 TaxID=1459636 RepID=A0A075MYD4_9ARCH|nr:hypothetical protein NTE_02220 [Candidatus Nitrososphaera evergladensis SR1]